MIRREDVADLKPGDVVEYAAPSIDPDVTLILRGPLKKWRGDSLVLASIQVRTSDGEPTQKADATLTVISRAPRLYVNSDRAEPAPGDVVRDADDSDHTGTWAFVERDWGNRNLPWLPLHGDDRRGCLRGHLPARLHLLVDGTTGQVVP